MNAYEAQRAARIAENKLRMNMLLQEAKALERLIAPSPNPRRPGDEPKTVKHRTRGHRSPHPNMRRSNRTGATITRNYAEGAPLFTYGDPVRRRGPKRSSGTRESIMTDNPSVRGGWHIGKGLAGWVAKDAALDAALDCMDGLQRPAAYKVMTESQVSSGFWSSAPRGITSHIAREKHSIYMTSAPGTKRPDGTTVGPDGSPLDTPIEVVWLPRKGNDAGFSGGWRAFSIIHDLYPRDVCVFEVADPKNPGEMSTNLIVHIFRAFDYQPGGFPAVQGEGPEQTMPRRRKAPQRNRAGIKPTKPVAAALMSDSEATETEVESESESESDEEEGGGDSQATRALSIATEEEEGDCCETEEDAVDTMTGGNGNSNGSYGSDGDDALLATREEQTTDEDVVLMHGPGRSDPMAEEITPVRGWEKEKEKEKEKHRGESAGDREDAAGPRSPVGERHTPSAIKKSKKRTMIRGPWRESPMQSPVKKASMPSDKGMTKSTDAADNPITDVDNNNNNNNNNSNDAFDVVFETQPNNVVEDLAAVVVVAMPDAASPMGASPSEQADEGASLATPNGVQSSKRKPVASPAIAAAVAAALARAHGAANGPAGKNDASKAEKTLFRNATSKPAVLTDERPEMRVYNKKRRALGAEKESVDDGTLAKKMRSTPPAPKPQRLQVQAKGKQPASKCNENVSKKQTKKKSSAAKNKRQPRQHASQRGGCREAEMQAEAGDAVDLGAHLPRQHGADEGNNGSDEDVEHYYVERIEASRLRADGTREYYIKWLNYAVSENTWEPSSMLDEHPSSYRRAPGVVIE